MLKPIEFSTKYLSETLPLFEEYKSPAFEESIELLKIAYLEQRNVFVCGNGGSASTATHIANDLSKCSSSPGKKRIKALCLADNMSLFSAYGNDDGYENVFVEQLKNLWQMGDLLIAISCSGNSPNIIKASEFALKNKGNVIGLVGFSGGKLLDLSTTAIHFKSHNYGACEDAQLMFSHLSSQYLYDFIKENGLVETHC